MPLNNFGIVVPSRLYRSGQPDALGFLNLRAIGIHKIIKLNSDQEYPLDLEMRQFELVVDHFAVDMWKPDLQGVRVVAAHIAASMSNGAVLVHCTHGRDRTGLIIGAYRLIYDHWMLPEVLKEFSDYGATGIIKLVDHEIIEALTEVSKQ